MTPPRSSARLLFMSFAVLAVMLVAAGALTLAHRQDRYHALATDTEAMSVPSVAATHPLVESGQDDLELPGTLQAYVESPIYAQTTGYLKKWYHDMGSHVRRGDALADLDTPEVDQELSQAKATRDQIQANLALAKSTADRWAEMLKKDAVAQQEADEKTSAYEQLKANLAGADASVSRLEDLEAFKHITAPFDGVITKRTTDEGTLVNTGTQTPLFQLAQTDPIRVYLSVPEGDVAGVKTGLEADLALSEYPGRKFVGHVARTANAIDLSTRTLLTEVDVPNPRGELLPGAYAQVHMKIGVSVERVQVPVNALLFRAEGLRVAVVDNDNRIHLRALTIGRDYGTSLEVLAGLSKDEWIILNPADSIADGQVVRVVKGK